VNPPPLAQRLLEGVVPAADREIVVGDLAEAFAQRRRAGRHRAVAWYWIQVLMFGLWYASRRGRARPPGTTRRRGAASLSGWRQDLTNAVRQARKRPLFSWIAVTTLALGIGGTTVMFAVVDVVLLRPLPYPFADQLIAVELQSTTGASLNHSEPDYLDFREYRTAFEDIGGVSGLTISLSSDGPPQELNAAWASGNLLPLLGIQPLLGRHFTDDEDVDGGPDAVIISYGLWQGRFGGAPSVIGRRIVLDGNPHTVVGVMPLDLPAILPRTFRVAPPFDLWLPLEASPDRFPRSARFLMVLGRVRSLRSAADAQTELDRIASDMRARFEDRERQDYGLRAVPLRDAVVAQREGPLALVFGAVALVLVIASGNVANLLLARTTERRRELQTRAMLGAGRARLVRLMLLEGGVLAAVGGGIGVLLAAVAVRYLVPMVPVDVPRLDQAAIDLRVAAFAIGVSGAAVLLCAGWPALRAGAAGPVGSGVRTVGSRDHRRVHRLLAGAEVALALVLLVGGAVLIRSMSAMYRFDPGFDPQQVLTFRVGLPGGEDGTSFIPTADFFQQLTEGLAELPGVMAAGGVTALPLSGRGMSIRYYDGTDENGRFADFHVVTPGYFESVGARLVAGRFVDGSDRQGGRNVVVIDQTLADRVWPNAAAVGRTMRLFSVTSLDPFHMGPTDAEVVGVIQPLMNHDPREDQLPQVYSPHGQVPFQTLSLAVRGETALPSTEAIERTVHALNPALPVADVRPLVSYVDSTFSTTRFVTTLLGTLAVLATLLAAIGVYGVLSYLTAQRTRELGLRLAMGATGQDLARFVVWEGMMPAMGGVAIGVVLAATMGRSLSGLLYGVDPFDVGTVAAVASGLLAISLAACLVPARRAGRTDPMVALRNE